MYQLPAAGDLLLIVKFEQNNQENVWYNKSLYVQIISTPSAVYMMKALGALWSAHLKVGFTSKWGFTSKSDCTQSFLKKEKETSFFLSFFFLFFFCFYLFLPAILPQASFLSQSCLLRLVTNVAPGAASINRLSLIHIWRCRRWP